MNPAQTFPDSPRGIAGHDRLAVLAAIEATDATLAVAQALAQAGRKLDLTGLDREVERICAAALALAPEDGREIAVPLHALLVRTGQLQASLAPPA